MTKARIAREVDEILAASKPRQGSNAAGARGEEAYRNIQSEARAAESEARMADNAQAMAAQRGPQSAHDLVTQSQQHADQSARFVAHAQAWVREARGAPQFAAVERVLASVQAAASRAKANATSTKRAFEERFGKYDPRGVRDHATRVKTVQSKSPRTNLKRPHATKKSAVQASYVKLKGPSVGPPGGTGSQAVTGTPGALTSARRPRREKR